MVREEYPRPQFRRNKWFNLNGTWRFDFDDDNIGITEKWYAKHEYEKEIVVPFTFQNELSGINENDNHATIWYQNDFHYIKDDRLLFLHIGASDYITDIWVDGNYVGNHVGGYTSFTLDISSALNAKDDNHEITIRVYDPIFDESIPRGKQNWTGKKESIWYENYTGIWQTVWLEPVNKSHLEYVDYYTDINKGIVEIKGNIKAENIGYDSLALRIKIKFGELLVSEIQQKIQVEDFKLSIDLLNNKIFRTTFHDSGWMWAPEHPVLFDCLFELIDSDEKILDRVSSYFGMREIKRDGHNILLNNKPLYQKLVLNQGYWRKGGYTAPNDKNFQKDIILAKELGFNGCRMHQKVEDPRFLYWADRLGFLVWGESGSNQTFITNKALALMKEWQEIVKRDFNHPSIITWVPLNESWGVPQIHYDKRQQNFAESLYHMIKMMDPTRLVSSTDGWEQVDTDICGIHNYAHGDLNDVLTYEHFSKSLKSIENIIKYPSSKWHIFAKGYKYNNQPVVLSEFGGIKFEIEQNDKDDWGYSNVNTEKEFFEEYRRILMAIQNSDCLVGYCYTQLYDVEQEKNGLLTIEREPKLKIDVIKKMNEATHYQWVDNNSTSIIDK